MEDSQLWHYFDFAKFLSLLEMKSLFFSSLDRLEDPLEGSLPAWAEESGPPGPSRELVFVSSWHLNSDESFAMWKLYSNAPEAVAIQTTMHKLGKTFLPAKGPEVLVKPVEYIDYHSECPKFEIKDGLQRYLCKAKPYAYENEVRAMVLLSKERDAELLKECCKAGGFYLPVELKLLIERIYVSPFAGEWFLKLVRSLLRRYEIELPVEQSVLRIKPNNK